MIYLSLSDSFKKDQTKTTLERKEKSQHVWQNKHGEGGGDGGWMVVTKDKRLPGGARYLEGLLEGRRLVLRVSGHRAGAPVAMAIPQARSIVVAVLVRGLLLLQDKKPFR